MFLSIAGPTDSVLAPVESLHLVCTCVPLSVLSWHSALPVWFFCPLWKELPVGVQMERLGGKLCPMDGRVENHIHVLRHCWFSPVMHDTVREAFGLVEASDRKVEPSTCCRNPYYI